MRFSIEDSIGVPLFRTDLEKVVSPGVRMPAVEGMTALLSGLKEGFGTGVEGSRLVVRSRGFVAVTWRRLSRGEVLSSTSYFPDRLEISRLC